MTKVFVIVLMLGGTGKALVVPDIYYETREQCETAARGAGHNLPSWSCLEGRIK